MSIYQKQKTDKPQIEDVIPDYLDGEMRKLALDIAAFLRANKMSPTWASGNSWKSSCKGKGICYVKLLPEANAHKWAVTLMPLDWRRYDEWVYAEGYADKFTEKPHYCHGCGRPTGESCGGRKDFTVNGKELKGVCGHNFMRWINDPDTETVNGIKRFLESEKAAR
jgi:hypothetical protein